MAVLGPDALACSFENIALSRARDPLALDIPEVKPRELVEAFEAELGRRHILVRDIRQFFPGAPV